MSRLTKALVATGVAASGALLALGAAFLAWRKLNQAQEDVFLEDDEEHDDLYEEVSTDGER